MEGPGLEEQSASKEKRGLQWSKVASEMEPEEGSMEFVSDFAKNRGWDRGEGPESRGLQWRRAMEV